MALSIITIDHPETSADMQRQVVAEAGSRFLAGQLLMKYWRALMGGARSARVTIGVNAVRATGTVTLASHAATNTVTINGVVLTAIASGATGPQYNIGGSDTLTAVNLAAAINAQAALQPLVSATSSGAVVTLTATMPCALGNAVTLAISANGSVSAARLAGGTNGEVERTHLYGSAS